MNAVLKNLTRKRKYVSSKREKPTNYVRCLNTLDVSALGIASTIGIAVYILIGKLARDMAGPSLVISFSLAAFSSLLSGICYAEFGTRIPKSGSAYVYTYLSLGEIWAFIAGWNMILEYIIGMSALGRACSEYMNSLSGGFIYKHFLDKLSWLDSPALAKFPDFLALIILILVSIIIGLGVKHSSMFNNTVTAINVIVIIFALCAGSYYADIRNWSSWEKFAPYGFQGVMTAAGSCFYAFAGFDVIGTAAEETIDPKKVLPRSILITIGASFLSYFGISIVLTLMQPYNQLDKFASLAEAFAQRGFIAAKYVVDVGAIASILTCLLAVSFGTPRLVHAIASDGLLFQWLDSINSKTRVPLRALVCSTIISGVLTVVLNLEQLVEMLSIGTLTAYTLVTAAVLLTRYQCDVQSVYDDDSGTTIKQQHKGRTRNGARVWLKTLCCKYKKNETKEHEAEYTQLSNCDSETPPNEPCEDTKEPTERSSFHASVALFVLALALVILCTTVSFAHNQIQLLKGWAIVVTCISGVIVISVIVFLYKLPRNSATFPFMVPFVPALPILTLIINFFLIVNLSRWTYVRFGVWMFIGK